MKVNNTEIEAEMNWNTMKRKMKDKEKKRANVITFQSSYYSLE